MRVLHWFPNYFHGGGVANAVTGMAHAQADAGAEVAIAGVSDDRQPLYGQQKTHAGVALLPWVPSSSRRLGDLELRRPSSDARKELRSWQPDVVHLHAEFAPDNVWPHRLFGRPLVLSPHGAFHPEVFSKGKGARKKAYVQLAQRLLYRRVASFHALTPDEALHIGALVPGSRVETIPLGPVAVDGVIELPAPVAVPGHGLRLLYVGRLDTYTKGLDTLIAAFAGARARCGDRIASLTLVGPDWADGQRRLEAQAAALGVGDAVGFAGGVPLAEVAGHVADADVYVQLSRHDAFPLSVVDALVAGKALVLSDAIGTTSYRSVRELGNVRVVPPQEEDAVSAIVDLAEHWGEVDLARRDAQDEMRRLFDWERIAQQHLDAYSTLAK